MRYLPLVLTGMILGLVVGCEPQIITPASAQAAQNKNFTPLPPSTARPVKSSLAVLAKWKSMGDLSVPYDNDHPGRPIFSPDGQWVAAPGSGWAGKRGSHGEKGLVFVWNTRTRSLAKKLEVPRDFSGPVTNLVWSPDSKRIAGWLSASGSSSPLCVWNVAAGSLLFSVSNENYAVSSVFYSKEGKMSVLWFDNSNPSGSTYLSIERGERRKLALDGFAIAQVVVLRSGKMLVLALKPVSALLTGELLVKASLRFWKGDRLSAPLIEFKTGEAILTMEKSRDEKFVVLSGVKQQTDPKKDNIDAIYAACDLDKRKILWRSQLNGREFSQTLSISPNSKQFWAQTSSKRQKRFDLQTGTITKENNNIPFFSLDGKIAVQGANENQGQKPFKSIFNLYKK